MTGCLLHHFGSRALRAPSGPGRLAGPATPAGDAGARPPLPFRAFAGDPAAIPAFATAAGALLCPEVAAALTRPSNSVVENAHRLPRPVPGAGRPAYRPASAQSQSRSVNASRRSKFRMLSRTFRMRQRSFPPFFVPRSPRPIIWK